MKESAEVVKINKVVVIFLSMVATVVGLWPFALLVRRLAILPYFAAGTVVLTWLMLLEEESIATERPGLLEFLLGGFGAVAMPALMSLLWMLLYGVLWGLLSLIFRLFANPPDPAPIAFYVSLGPGIIALMGAVAGNVVNLVPQLYPEEVGIKSAFYEYITQGYRRILLWTAVIVVVLGGGLWWFFSQGGTGNWFYIALQIFLFIISVPVMMMEAETRRSKVQYVVTQVSTLLQRLGYEVQQFPRAYDADYDLWLVNLDLCAQQEGQHVLVQVRTPGETPKLIDWMAVSDFMTAASVWIQYQEEFNNLQVEEQTLLMILMEGIQEDKSFSMGVKREGITVLHLASAELAQVLQLESDAEQQAAARRLLQVSSWTVTASGA